MLGLHRFLYSFLTKFKPDKVHTYIARSLTERHIQVRGGMSVLFIVSGLTMRRRSTSAANWRTVGASKRVRKGSSMPKVRVICATNCAPSMEWPPSIKKLWSLPTCSTCSRAATISATFSSANVLGGAKDVSCKVLVSLGGGNAARSIFPLGVSGSASSKTKLAGTCYQAGML